MTRLQLAGQMKPKDPRMAQLLAHKRMRQAVNFAAPGAAEPDEWAWTDMTALRKLPSGDVEVCMDWGEWCDEKGNHETWEPLRCIPASEDAFVSLVEDKMEKNPKFFDDDTVKVQFLDIGICVFIPGQVTILPELIKKRDAFLATLTEEEREYKKQFEEARKEAARDEKAKVQKAYEATNSGKKEAAKRAAEKRKAEQLADLTPREMPSRKAKKATPGLYTQIAITADPHQIAAPVRRTRPEVRNYQPAPVLAQPQFVPQQYPLDPAMRGYSPEPQYSDFPSYNQQ